MTSRCISDRDGWTGGKDETNPLRINRLIKFIVRRVVLHAGG